MGYVDLAVENVLVKVLEIVAAAALAVVVVVADVAVDVAVVVAVVLYLVSEKLGSQGLAYDSEMLIIMITASVSQSVSQSNRQYASVHALNFKPLIYIYITHSPCRPGTRLALLSSSSPSAATDDLRRTPILLHT